LTPKTQAGVAQEGLAGTTIKMMASSVSSNGASAAPPPKSQSRLFGAAANLVNAIVGAGIVGIPYAMRQSGLVVGVALLVLVSWMTDKSLRMMIELATFHPLLLSPTKRKVVTLEDLMSIPFGNYGRIFILGSMLVLAYGAMCAYLIIIKDTVPTVLGLSSSPGSGRFVETELIMIVTSLLIVLPLSMMRDMASLSITSTLSVLADVVLVGFVVAYAPVSSTVRDNGGLGDIVANHWIHPQLFIGLGVLSTAMACQHAAFIVSGSLRHLTAARWSIVTKISLSVAAALCLTMGLAGFLGFLEGTQGDVLNNFPADSLESNAGRGLLAVTMFCK
jgi:solute carrier family 38 (sodium-coupled neutral amino acid transporter), member 11